MPQVWRLISNIYWALFRCQWLFESFPFVISSLPHSRSVMWKQFIFLLSPWRKLRHRRVRVWRSPQGNKWWGWHSISAIHRGHALTLRICAKSMWKNRPNDWSQLLLRFCHSEPQGSGIGGGSSRTYGVRGRSRFLLASHTNWGNNISTCSLKKLIWCSLIAYSF